MEGNNIWGIKAQVMTDLVCGFWLFWWEGNTAKERSFSKSQTVPFVFIIFKLNL